MSRRIKFTGIMLLIMTFLAGCSTDARSKPIDPANGFWDKFFVNPLSQTLDWFANFFGNEYGISILIVTVIIRLIILPLTIKQFKSSRKMQEIQPELKKLQKKYKDDTQEQQQETMKLFQQHGVNPMAGCFPVLVQMPILIGLYHAIMRNPEISSHSFLWLQLGEKDPFVLPILAAATTFFQQKMMSTYMPNQQMQMMQTMMFIFPILIFVMAMSFPSALPLYWIYSNLFTIVQNYFLYGRSQTSQASGGSSSK